MTRSAITHYGGDEVGNIGCWATDPFGRVQAWAKPQGPPLWLAANKTVNTTILLGIFERQVAKSAVAVGVSPVFWADAFKHSAAAGTLSGTPKNAVFQSWSGMDHGDVLRAGFKAISSAGWYLDQTSPSPGGPTTYAFADNWHHMWQLDPLGNGSSSVGSLTAAEAKRFLGGEVAMWSEKVDATNVEQSIWPRSCAVAERLWSSYPHHQPSGLPDVSSDVETRLEAQRCRMVRRGIAAGPTQPQTADTTWHEMNSDGIPGGYTGWSGGPCTLPPSPPADQARIDELEGLVASLQAQLTTMKTDDQTTSTGDGDDSAQCPDMRSGCDQVWRRSYCVSHD